MSLAIMVMVVYILVVLGVGVVFAQGWGSNNEYASFVLL